MKQFSDIIATGFRLLIFSLVFSSIILQPVVESIVVSEPQAFSWLDIETENDSNEKENKALLKKMNPEEKREFFNNEMEKGEDSTLNILKNIKSIIDGIEEDHNQKFESISFSRESANIKDFSDNLWETFTGNMGYETFALKNYKFLRPENNKLLNDMIDEVLDVTKLLKIEVSDKTVKQIKKFVSEINKNDITGIGNTLDVVKQKPNKVLASKQSQDLVRLFLNESLKIQNSLNAESKLSSRIINSENPLLKQKLCNESDLTMKEIKRKNK